MRGIAPRPGDRVLSDKEIRKLWDKVKDTEKGQALMLMLLTGQSDRPRWTPKDLRRTLRTGLAKLGVPEEHAEAVLNHIQGGVKGVYNLYKYDEQKKAALIKWPRHIESVLHPTHSNSEAE